MEATNEMRLLEAIMEANHRAAAGDLKAGLHPDEFADSLPVVALTCIDARLNPLIPEVLGVPEEKFIWLRNAGNIITAPMSSTMRSLALACAVKGGKEIAIIGHSDCLVRKTSMVELTDRLKALGIERAKLPENLNEYFGLFASERQNVIRGVDLVRQSPLIGPKIPVHGLLVDIQTGRLEWLVNGYQVWAGATAPVATPQPAPVGTSGLDLKLNLPDFNLGGMKSPEVKIGDVSVKLEREPVATPTPTHERPETSAPASSHLKLHVHLDKDLAFKILGADQKEYGPVPVGKILQWLAEGRIDEQTPAQAVGSVEWKPLAAFTDLLKKMPSIPLPPALTPQPRFQKGKER